MEKIITDHRRLKLIKSSPGIIAAISQIRIEPSIAEEIVSIKNLEIQVDGSFVKSDYMEFTYSKIEENSLNAVGCTEAEVF
jgi:methyl coenzyme M reductase subunit C-like uncharacterized protein (methanogenesis marker protein 7)